MVLEIGSGDSRIAARSSQGFGTKGSCYRGVHLLSPFSRGVVRRGSGVASEQRSASEGLACRSTLLVRPRLFWCARDWITAETERLREQYADDSNFRVVSRAEVEGTEELCRKRGL